MSSIESQGAQVIGHGMTGRADLEHKTFAATGLSWREHLYVSLHQFAVQHGEREYVGWWHRNGSAEPALEHAYRCFVEISQDRRETLAVTPDIDGRDELVVAPNLPPRAVRHCGGDGEVRHIDCWNRVTWRLSHDGQADFIVRANICNAVLYAIE